VHRTRIKFCGITDPIDAQVASRCGADAIGMILHAKSPRLIDADRAAVIARSIPPMVSRVGVFVDANAAFVAQTARTLPLDYVQLHGHESPDYVRSLHAFRVIRAVTLDTLDAWRECDLPNLVALLIDSGAGGTGIANDWDRLEATLRDRPIRKPVILAGGLDPRTVGPVVSRLQAWAVDVSSGVESAPGRKCPDQLSDFARAVANADAHRLA
jgi:phosphoribosylanthranilate isomerase